MRYAMTTLLDHEAMPIFFVLSIKFLFYLASYVREMRWIMTLESSQSRYDCVLDFVWRHICALNQNSFVSRFPESAQSSRIVTR